MKFKVLEPLNLDEAAGIAADTNAPILAGGTDLLIKIKRGLIRPDTVLSLHRISALNCLSYEAGKGLYIGALVTHARVAQSSIIREKFSALAEACAVVGSPQIRNLGTVVGNIANASPAADTAPALLALGAEVSVRSITGVRNVQLHDFFQGPGQTALEHGDIIEGIGGTWYKCLLPGVDRF
ncbi:MAG: FAD binding domain-containing protein [Desulfitobacteriaceae bacterium]